MMKNYVHPNKNNLFIIAELKVELLNSLEEKYASSITELHWVASYLDPSFKNFSFIDDLEYLETKKKMIRKGIHILPTDLFNESNTTFSVHTQNISTSSGQRIRDGSGVNTSEVTGTWKQYSSRKIFGIFSGDFRPVPDAKRRKVIGIHRKFSLRNTASMFR